MRIFVAAVLFAAILAGGAYTVLTSVQKSSTDAYTTGSSRLDWQEQSDFQGREIGQPSLIAE